MPIFAAIVAVSILYMPSVLTLWQKWILWDQDLAHAIPTIGVMLVLLGKCRYITQDAASGGARYWLLLLATACSSVGWYLFEGLSISLPAYFLLIATLCFFIGASFSTSTLQEILPILGLILFTIPIWSELTGTLVTLSTLAVGTAVKWSNLTVLIDGSSLFIPSGTIYIADGCSGIRYLIISLLMGYILILVNQYRLRIAITTLMVAAVLGLFANWLRIYLLVLIGYHTEMRSSLMSDHETFGWILFACLLVPAIYFAPINKSATKIVKVPRRPRLLPLMAIALGPLLLHLNTTALAPVSPLHLDHLATLKVGAVAGGMEISPGIKQSDSQTIRLNDVDIRVDLFTHTPTQQREEIVPFISKVTERSDWSLERRIAHGQNKFSLAMYKKVGGNTRVILATQYIVGNFQTQHYVAAKFLQILANASGDKYFGLLTAQVNCEDDCSNELEKLSRSLTTINIPQKS